MAVAVVLCCSSSGAARAFTHRPSDPHLPMRDRGGRVGPVTRCRGLLVSTTKGTRTALWYLRAPGSSPKLLTRLGSDVEVWGAAVAPSGRTAALDLVVPEDRAYRGMRAFSRTGPVAPSSARILIAELMPGERPRRIARFAGSGASWSRDGRRLAFVRGKAVLVSSSVAWAKAEFVTWGSDPSWSPAENALAVVRGVSRAAMIQVLTPDGATLLTDGTRIDEDPVWSPDGRRLLFRRKQRPGGWPDLWIVGRSGGAPRRLTHFNHYNGAVGPLWSPDGKRVAFTMANSEAWGARILDPRTGRTREVPHLRHRHGGLGPFTSAAAWRTRRSLLYEVGMGPSSLWVDSPRRGSVQVLERTPGLEVLDAGLCGRPPRRL